MAAKVAYRPFLAFGRNGLKSAYFYRLWVHTKKKKTKGRFDKAQTAERALNLILSRPAILHSKCRSRDLHLESKFRSYCNLAKKQQQQQH